MSDPQHGFTHLPPHDAAAGIRTDRDEPHHGHGHAVALPFNDADWAQFHRDDITAGKAVIVLMTAIFAIGVALYTVVALSCLS